MTKEAFTKEEIAAIVKRVVYYFIHKRERREAAKRMLFVVPEYPMGLAENLSEYALYGELDQYDFLLSDHYEEVTHMAKGCIYHRDNPAEMKELLSALSRYQEAEIYAPSMDFLRSLRDGHEEDMLVRVSLYFVMTEKNVVIRLPYRLERLPDGRFSKTVKDLMDDLWEMGFSFADLKPTFDSDESGRRGLVTGLVTEEIVEEYYRRGFRSIKTDSNTVITPLAAELAKQRGVKLGG